LDITNLIIKLKKIDQLLIGLLCLIIIVGLFTVASSEKLAQSIIMAQLINIFVGVSSMLLIILSDPKKIFTLAPLIYLLSLFLLVLVQFFGYEVNGSQRWLNLGLMKFQPSELLKVTLPLALAWFYHINESKISWKTHIVGILIILIPFMLILIQPDLGTALMISFIALSIIFCAGLSLKLIGWGVIILLLSSPFIWNSLENYQQSRILTMFDPFSDALGSGYQTIQSMIALGSGGLIGKGWNNAQQTFLEFLPEASTDFIFAVFSEEFGFIGVMAILSIYFLFLLRCNFMISRMQDTFSRLLSLGLIVSIFMGLIINLGMISGLLPIVGVPLPFFSYGGTSMVVSLISIGIIMNLYTNKTLIAN
jgi:rod shape determining protein RodA